MFYLQSNHQNITVKEAIGNRLYHVGYLPNNEQLYNQEKGEIDEMPSLPFTITKSDLKNLTSTCEAFAITDYGYAKQNKPNNQDFALAGSIDNFTFSILADGVSNGFLYSQRGAHISCLCAYFEIKKFIETHQEFSHSNIQLLKESITSSLNKKLSEDRELILQDFANDKTGILPKKVSPTYFEKTFKNNPKKWYGNTLIISLLSPKGGLVLQVGDGAVIIYKSYKKLVGKSSPDEVKQFSMSGKGMLANYVHIGMPTTEFISGRIGMDNVSHCWVVSATDGVDRSSQQCNIALEHLLNDKNTAMETAQRWINICIKRAYTNNRIDVDNYSLARIETGSRSVTKQPHKKPKSTKLRTKNSQPSIKKQPPQKNADCEVQTYYEYNDSKIQADATKQLEHDNQNNSVFNAI